MIDVRNSVLKFEILWWLVNDLQGILQVDKYCKRVEPVFELKRRFI